MKESLKRSLAALSACGVMLSAGCGEDVTSSVGGCDIAATVVFHGREYTEGGLDDLPQGQIKRDRRLGVGEMAACKGAEGDRVRVFKIVGVPAQQAVYIDRYGSMVRSHFDKE